MENTEKKREINIEVLRIIAMIMVIALHCIMHSLIKENENLSNYNWLLVETLRTLSLVANSIFIIITGYYLIDKKFNIKKVLLLWGKTIFYSILIFVICQLGNMQTNWIESIFPVLSGQYWFITASIFLYLLAPVINILVNKLSKNQFKYLLAILLIAYGIIRTIFYSSGIFSGLAVPVLIIYLIGAYIRKYANIKRNGQYLLKYFLIAIIFLLVFIVLKVVLYINVIYNINAVIKNIVLTMLTAMADFYNLFCIAMTVMLFMKFRTFNIKSNKITKLVNIISPSILSIYLIHENVNIRVLWTKCGIENYANSIWLVPYMLMLIIIVFVICLIIDFIRRSGYCLIKRIPLCKRCINKLDEKVNKINRKINNYLSV